MNQLDYITEGVTDSTGIVPSSVRTLQNIAAQVRIAAGNYDASIALADLLSSRADHISRAVLANTPMITATHETHPAPGSTGPVPDKLDATSMTGTPEEIDAWSKDHDDVEEIRRKDVGGGKFTAYFLPREDEDRDQGGEEPKHDPAAI